MVLSIGTRDPAVEKKTIEDKSDWSSEKWLILCNIYLNVCDYVIHGFETK